jgi:hypothetical protein
VEKYRCTCITKPLLQAGITNRNGIELVREEDKKERRKNGRNMGIKTVPEFVNF